MQHHGSKFILDLSKIWTRIIIAETEATLTADPPPAHKFESYQIVSSIIYSQFKFV